MISCCRKWKIWGLETSTVNFHQRQREITLYEATALFPTPHFFAGEVGRNQRGLARPDGEAGRAEVVGDVGQPWSAAAADGRLESSGGAPQDGAGRARQGGRQARVRMAMYN